jgi:multiple sugar transport system ATP-binding protein
MNIGVSARPTSSARYALGSKSRPGISLVTNALFVHDAGRITVERLKFAPVSVRGEPDRQRLRGTSSGRPAAQASGESGAEAPPMASIKLEGVTKRFPDGTLAVDNLDLEVTDGEFMILVGPSGCGKTTALRMVAGLEEVTEGAIRVGDRVVNDLSAAQRDMAMVFQNYALYPHMTVQRNIAFPLRMARTKKSESQRQVREVAELLGIEALLHRKPGELSGGQRQRVAMGRAIVRHPKAFLMDEPLSNLDAKLRVQMRAELVKLHRRLGATTLYVTHDQTEAMTLGQRVAVLNRGVLQQVDSPQGLYNHPVNTFVASFIGSPAMNFVHGRLAGAAVELGDYRIALPDALLSRITGNAEAVLVGLRPEAFDDASDTASEGRTVMEANVELTEELGPETYAYFRVDGVKAVEIGEHPVELAGALAARLGPQTKAAAGHCIGLAVNPAAIHIFDPASGRSLLST